MKRSFGVLISGSGTNLQALIDASQRDDYPGRLSVVISNRADVMGLQRAQRAGINAMCIDHRGKTRKIFETELIAALQDHDVELVALAGFMRLLTPFFLDAFDGQVVNIHPALSPSFPGIHGQQQAFEYGVRISGATVHFVDAGTDTGPIICQGAVPVYADDDHNTMKERILRMEHRLYPHALRLALSGDLVVQGRRVLLPREESGWMWQES